LDCNRERWANAQKGVGYAVLFVNQYLADRFARELLSFRHPMPKVIMPALVHRTGTSFPLAWTCPRQTWLVHHFTVSRKFTEGTNNVEGSAPIKAHRPCRRVSLVRLFLKTKNCSCNANQSTASIRGFQTDEAPIHRERPRPLAPQIDPRSFLFPQISYTIHEPFTFLNTIRGTAKWRSI